MECNSRRRAGLQKSVDNSLYFPKNRCFLDQLPTVLGGLRSRPLAKIFRWTGRTSTEYMPFLGIFSCVTLSLEPCSFSSQKRSHSPCTSVEFAVQLMPLA